jgi:hypothetical protein
MNEVPIGMNKPLIALVMIIILGAYQFWTTKPISRPAGILAAAEPEQINLEPSDRKPENFKNVVIEPLARFKIQARILSVHRYWLDRAASIAPYDLAVGWGPMSDSKVIDTLNISQEDRFYFFSYQPEKLPITAEQISLHSTNIHIIPNNAYIKQQISNLHVGHIVTMTGSLVRVNYRDGGEWKSSLIRTDTGDGACEIMKVDSISMN